MLALETKKNVSKIYSRTTQPEDPTIRANKARFNVNAGNIGVLMSKFTNVSYQTPLGPAIATGSLLIGKATHLMLMSSTAEDMHELEPQCGRQTIEKAWHEFDFLDGKDCNKLVKILTFSRGIIFVNQK